MPRPEAQDGETPTETVEEMTTQVAAFAAMLRHYLDWVEQRPKGIQVPLGEFNLFLSPVQLEQIYEAVSGMPEEIIRGRLVKIRESMSHNPVDQLIGGALLRADSRLPKGWAPRRAASWLRTDFLPRFFADHPLPVEEGKPAPGEEAPPLGTLTNLLDELANEWETSVAIPTSLISQLGDVLCSTGQGLTISAGEGTGEGASVLQEILQILEILKFPEAGKLLQDWIIAGVDGEGRSGCIGALGTIAQATFLLDEASLYQKLHAGGNGGISFLPFRSLHKAVVAARDYLKGIRGAERDVLALQGVERLIMTRYSQVIISLPELEAGEASLIIPPYQNLATLFSDSYQQCKDHLTPAAAAYYIVLHLQQLGVFPDYVNQFCSVLEIGGNPELDQAVRREAIIMNLLPDQGNAIALSELAIFAQSSWIDATDIPFQDREGNVSLEKVIPPGTEKVFLYVLTGTFGPGHCGHGDLIRKVTSYLAREDEADKLEGKANRRILLILPITQPETLGERYPKKIDEVGPLPQRVFSLLTQIVGVDQTRVLISTLLQPVPGRAGRVESSMLTAANSLVRIWVEQFERHGRLANFQWQVIAVAGADEIKFKERGDRLILHHEQDPKFRQLGDWLLMGRHRLLVGLIENFHLIIGKMKIHPTLLLTPGIPGASSKSIRETLRTKSNRPKIPSRILGTPYIEKWWSPAAIANRPEPPQKIPSVGEIYQSGLEELRRFILEEQRKRRKT